MVKNVKVMLTDLKLKIGSSKNWKSDSKRNV